MVAGTCLAVLLPAFAIWQAGPEKELVQAREAFKAQIKKAEQLILSEIESRDKKLRESKSLFGSQRQSALEMLKEQKRAFERDRALPKAKDWATTVKQYHKTRDDARRALVRAYDAAIDMHLKARTDEKAAFLKKELDDLLFEYFSHPRAINLLAHVRLGSGRDKGEWVRRVDGYYGTPKGDPTAILEFPYKPPPEYDLRVVAGKVDAGKDACLIVGLATSATRFGLGIDSFPKEGYWTGLSFVDKRHSNNNATSSKSQRLKRDDFHEVFCEVRRDRVTVRFDGKELFNFNRLALLSLPDNLRVTGDRVLAIACQEGTCRFKAVELIPVSGTGEFIKKP